jgi:hypothetical protein
MAMRRLSAGVNFFERASAATREILERSPALSFFARALPPNFPSATAARFFLAISRITILA